MLNDLFGTYDRVLRARGRPDLNLSRRRVGKPYACTADDSALRRLFLMKSGVTCLIHSSWGDAGAAGMICCRTNRRGRRGRRVAALRECWMSKSSRRSRPTWNRTSPTDRFSTDSWQQLPTRRITTTRFQNPGGEMFCKHCRRRGGVPVSLRSGAAGVALASGRGIVRHVNNVGHTRRGESLGGQS